MRWRLGASLLTVLTSTIAVAAAVLGPMYLHTAGDSVVRQTVASAAVQDRGLTLVAAAAPARPLAAIQRAERIAMEAGRTRSLYGAPITTVTSGVTLRANKSELLWRTGICHVLRFVRGDCNLGPGDVVMTERSARSLKLALGSSVDVRVTGRRTPLLLRVTGIVATPNLGLPYWWGEGPQDFPFGRSFSAPGSAPLTDPLIASSSTVLAVPPQDVPAAIGQLPLDKRAVTLGTEAGARRALHEIVARLRAQRIRVGTRLGSLLSAADHQRHSMSTIVVIAAIQLVLLAVWVLVGLLLRSSDARRSEARVARLRGFSPASMLWVTAAEPAFLCLLGAILGVGLAWLTMVVARGQLFAASATITLDVWTVGALALTLATIAGALVLSAMRLLGSADPAETPAPTIRRLSSWTQVADVVLIVLAIVGLVALGTNGALAGHSDPLASAAPGLLALGIAVLAVQLFLFGCRLGIPATAGSSWVGTSLALRQTARRPGLLRQARVLLVALALACFAASTWSVARTNRMTAAEFQLGASQVVHVAATSPTHLENAVRRADPAGRFAMAAIDLQTSSASLLAVESSRLGAAASWPRGISRRSLGGIARRIAPSSLPVVQLRVAPLRVAVRATVAPKHADLDLGVWVLSGTAGTTAISLGRLRDGEHIYRGSVPSACTGGCQLSGFGIIPAPGHSLPMTGRATIDISRVWSQVRGGASQALPADLVSNGWRAVAPEVHVQTAPHRLRVMASAIAIDGEADSIGAVTEPMVAPADHPGVLPAAVTPEDETLNANQIGPLPTSGLDGNPIRVQPAALVSALPRVGAYAEMVDLSLLSRIQVDPISADAADEVWLGPQSPADAVARLRAAGLQPIRIQRASATYSDLEHSGPALADNFLLFATIAALLVAAATTLGTLGATVRDRATELTSLEVAGVPRAALVRALALESAILILTAVCGVGAGVVAAWMAIPSLPELSSGTLAPLSYRLPAGLIVVVTVAVLATVALAAAFVAALLLRRMSPTLLRTAPNDVSA